MGSKMGIDATKPSLFEPEKREEFARARPVGTDQVRLADFLPQELAAQLKQTA
jgi:3-polyprenyl-4-hydroxybenzoate decarboxylase